MMVKSVFVWMMAVQFHILVCKCQTFNQSKELLQTVLKNYDKRLRPNLDQSKPTKVNASFGILSIDDFDEVSSKFAVNGFLYLTWIDETINWSPDSNHGIHWLRFPVKDVWYPNLMVAYTHGKPDTPVQSWMEVRIFYNGYAVLIAGDLYKTTCRADVTYYPFDFQSEEEFEEEEEEQQEEQEEEQEEEEEEEEEVLFQSTRLVAHEFCLQFTNIYILRHKLNCERRRFFNTSTYNALVELCDTAPLCV